jgi:hypothetical protein
VTVTEMVRAIRAEVRDTEDLAPHRASDLLIRLTAIYGNVLDEVRAADMAYSEVLLAALNGDEAAARAKIRAQVSPEYARAREAKDTEKLALELIRSLKHFLRMKGEEMRLG